jgi:glycosyltransferase involved in cell wall biosynthesis
VKAVLNTGKVFELIMNNEKVINTEILISVIICTKDRPDDLNKFLISVNNQKMLPDEIIIVDSSKGTATRELINSKIKSSKFRIEYIKSKSGLTFQRNIGVNKSHGKYLFFFDDDIVLDQEYISVIYNTFQKYKGKNIGGIAGRISNNILKRDIIDELFKKIFFLTSLGKGKLKLSGFPSHRLDNNFSFVEIVYGGTVAYKRDIFNKYKFDEKLEGYSYMEDIDFSYRVSREYKLIYQPQAKLKHYATTYKNSDDRVLRRMMVQNHSYIFRKNLRQDFMHIYAHLLSILGLFLYNLFLWKNLRACLGILEGFWYGTIQKQGPYNKKL